MNHDGMKFESFFFNNQAKDLRKMMRIIIDIDPDVWDQVYLIRKTVRAFLERRIKHNGTAVSY